MRYQDWDVLIFPAHPDQSKIPIQEFKTACTVIQDPESHAFQTSPHLLPTITSFIPALRPGTAFRVSIHCWQNPELSRYIQAIRRPSDSVIFEARLFIDGKIVGSRWFHQNGPWPTVIELSIGRFSVRTVNVQALRGTVVDKHGEFEKLKFPAFHRELLSQSYWSAGDDFGRIKLIISEGFTREHLAYPYERIKNVVAFSFQHAPLDVLEQSSIAWPNQGMWRQVSLVGPYVGQQQQVSPRKLEADLEVHSHSPRHVKVMAREQVGQSSAGIVSSIFARPTANFDPFVDHPTSSFTNWRSTSGNDISMQDFISSGSQTRASNSRQVTDPMSLTGQEQIGVDANIDSLCEAMGTRPPANTPQNGENIHTNLPVTISTLDPRYAVIDSCPRPNSPRSAAAFIFQSEGEENKQCAAKDLETITVMQKPAVSQGIKGRKENIQQGAMMVSTRSSSTESAPRKASQTFASTTNGNNKRQRVTPASSKAIDDEDEPRSSPSARKASRTSAKDSDGQKRVLSNITNV